MSVDTLISTVKEKTEEEKNKIREEHERKTAEEERKRREEIARKEKDFAEKISQEREKMIEEYRKEKEFALRMRILKEEKKAMEEVKKIATQEVLQLPLEKRKQIILEALKTFTDLLRKEDVFVFSPIGKKQEVQEIVQDVEIKKEVEEKEMGFKEGVVIKGKDFTVCVSLEDLAHKTIEEDKNHFLKLLFSEK